MYLCVNIQYLELNGQYEKKQKELKNLCVEEGQLKRALVMRLDKKSKQNIRRQKKRDMKERHVQDVLGYLTSIHISKFTSGLLNSVREFRIYIHTHTYI